MIDDPAARRFVRTELVTLALAAVAMFAITATLLSWRDAIDMLRFAPTQIAVGYAAMLTAVFAVARPLGRHFEAKSVWLAPWNLMLFVLGVTAACASNWLIEDLEDPSAYFVKPLVPLLMFGSIPALAIGLFADWWHRMSMQRSRTR